MKLQVPQISSVINKHASVERNSNKQLIVARRS
jgi:hypothetical protein